MLIPISPPKPNEKPVYQADVTHMIIDILKDITNVDICLYVKFQPNMQALNQHCNLTRYVEPKSKRPTDTHYVNSPNILMISKIIIYNKAVKNNLSEPLWRIEATVNIPNCKDLVMPLKELHKFVKIATNRQD